MRVTNTEMLVSKERQSYMHIIIKKFVKNNKFIKYSIHAIVDLPAIVLKDCITQVLIFIVFFLLHALSFQNETTFPHSLKKCYRPLKFVSNLHRMDKESVRFYRTNPA